jgi:phosphoribosylformylglycinamidine synthase
VVSSRTPLDFDNAVLLGRTTTDPVISLGNAHIQIDQAIAAWQGVFEPVYPTIASDSGATASGRIPPASAAAPQKDASQHKVVALNGSPLVYLPVFPGTNCEYDSARAFEAAGAKANIEVFRNRHHRDVQESISQMAKQISKSQILMLSGGFSAGDEPDGSGKFIAAVLQNGLVRDAVEGLLSRGGLILGICNGFQALIKVGLLPYGEFGSVTPESPTLVKNDINRHISKIVQTTISSKLSPWLAGTRIGEHHNVVVSHGEGKFVAPEAVLADLAANGQIATQYIDPTGQPTMDPLYNPNGSAWAIEGITSTDGRIFGKMGHSERIGPNLYKNVLGNYDQQLFRSGVEYFRK